MRSFRFRSSLYSDPREKSFFLVALAYDRDISRKTAFGTHGKVLFDRFGN